MSKKNIISIGFDFPGGSVDYFDFDTDNSLVDYDIIVFSPQLYGSIVFYEKEYQGKPSLSESKSFVLKEKLNHWQRELNEAFNSGKTIFFSLDDLQEFFVDTGKRKYSGTGRNQKTTILVEKTNNYITFPINISFRAAKGNKMFINKNYPILENYWNNFSKYSSYRAIIEGETSKNLLISKDGNHIFSSLFLHKSSTGAIILLPHLEIDDENFIKEKNDEVFWTKDAVAFGNKLIKELLEIDMYLKSSLIKSPRPSWVLNSDYVLDIEKESYDKLNVIENEIQQLTTTKEQLKNQLEKETEIKNLLYENGKILEKAVLEALSLLGFKANNYKESDSEFDVVFESAEGRFIGEVEGKDSKAINIDKLRQLEMNIHEDFCRDEVKEPAKGVLFGNAYRLLPLEERGEFFTDKCKIAAERSKTVLVKTTDLFFIVKYLKQKKDNRFAKKCREAILYSDSTVIVFPEIKNLGNKTKNLKETKVNT